MSDRLEVNNNILFVQKASKTDFDLFMESMSRNVSSTVTEFIDALDYSYGVGVIGWLQAEDGSRVPEAKCFWTSEGRRVTFRNISRNTVGPLTIRIEVSPGADMFWINNRLGIRSRLSGGEKFMVPHGESTDFTKQ